LRKINEIIIHCSATPEGRDVTVEEIRQWHLDRGFNDIGYHYIIDLDGVVHDGRPIEKPGAHCVKHNTHSLSICYIGGTDAHGRAKDTRTLEQKNHLKI
jgi:N-acetylmuramoyl-L-alanine amidase